MCQVILPMFQTQRPNFSFCAGQPGQDSAAFTVWGYPTYQMSMSCFQVLRSNYSIKTLNPQKCSLPLFTMLLFPDNTICVFPYQLSVSCCQCFWVTASLFFPPSLQSRESSSRKLTTVSLILNPVNNVVFSLFVFQSSHQFRRRHNFPRCHSYDHVEDMLSKTEQ